MICSWMSKIKQYRSILHLIDYIAYLYDVWYEFKIWQEMSQRLVKKINGSTEILRVACPRLPVHQDLLQVYLMSPLRLEVLMEVTEVE